MENKKIRNKKRELTISFVITITLLLFFSGYSMGKAYQNTSVQARAKVAEPIMIVENNPVVQMNGKNEKEYYNFKVKNNKENGKITEVDLEYNIEIITKAENLISFKLYKDDKEIPLKNNRTDNIKLEKGKAQEDNYKLEIIYNKNEGHSIDDIIEDVQIKVHSEQL